MAAALTPVEFVAILSLVSLPSAVLRRPVAAVTCLVAALVLGLVSLARLPVAYLPEIEGRSLTITASYSSSSPEEVERSVCRPLEEELASLTGLESLSATARADGATISVELAAGIDPDQAQLDVRERIDRARPQLPPDLGRIEVRRWRSSDRPVFRFRLAAEGEDEAVRLPSYVDEVLIPRLSRLEGVSSVEVRGLTRDRVLVDLSRARLYQAGLTAREVVNALQSRNRNVAAGQLRAGGRILSVRILGELGDVEAVASLPIGSHVLADLGGVRAEREPLDRITRLDGREALTIRVSKESGSNSVEVCQRIGRELEALRVNNVSAGYRFEVISDDSERIGARLRNLEESGLFGGLLLCAVLFVFLRRLRPTLVVAATIPCSVIGSFALIYLLRQAGVIQTSLNVVSLMGLILGIGLVVDNGIVVLENIVRLRDEGLSVQEAASRGASEVSTAITASVATSLIVFVPMLFSEGQGSAWTRDLAIMVCATVFASLFAALTVVPLLAARSLGEPRPERADGWPRRFYGWLLARSLRWRWLVVLLVLPACGWQIHRFFTTVERSWGSGEVERELDLRVSVPRGLGGEERRQLFDDLEARILAERDALDLRRLTTNFALRPDAPSQRGRGGGDTDRLELLLHDGPGQRPSLSQVRERLRALLPERPGVVYNLGGGGGRGGGRDPTLRIEVSGRSSHELIEPARRVALALGGIPGIEEIELGEALAAVGVEVSPQREVAARYGVSAQQVGRAVASSLSERAVTRLRASQRELEVVVRLDGAEDEGLSSLERMGVRARGGAGTAGGAGGAGSAGAPAASAQVELQLSALARISRVPAPREIKRSDRQAVVEVTCSLSDSEASRTVSEAISERLKGIPLPNGVQARLAQDLRRRWRGEQQNPLHALLALVLVLMLLSALFESVIDALVIAATVPFALVGVAWAFWLSGTRLGDMAWIGFMILIGIVVNHGIVLVDRFHQLDGSDSSWEDALIQAGRDRMRPIVMTAATTVLGLLPVVGQHLFPEVFRADSGAQVYGPIGLAVASGLVVSTALSLLVLPAVLGVSLDVRRWLGARRRASAAPPAEVPA